MNPRTRFYAKQNEAIIEVRRKCFFALFGEDIPDTLVNLIEGKDIYQLEIEVRAEEVADSRADQDAYSEPDTKGYEYTVNAKQHYNDIINENALLHYYTVKHFIYHPNFAEHFQKEIGTCPPWRAKYLLEEVFSPQSLAKPNQLDGWEDYEYLADVLRASLVNTTYEDATFNKVSLQIGVDWLLETIRQLRPERIEQTDVEGLKWQGSKAELAELGYSLLEAGLIKAKEGERGAVLAALGHSFGLDLGKPESHLQTIQKRKSAVSSTPLLDRLKRAFEAFLERREK